MREGEAHFELCAGQTLLLRPGAQHEGMTPYAPNTSFYWVHFYAAGPCGGEEGVVEIPQAAMVTRPDVLTGLFRRFLDDQEAGLLRPGSAGHLVALMLHETALHPQIPADFPGPAAVIARHAQQYLVTHFADRDLSASTIARVLDCHPDYLGRCFRASYGITITTAIHRQRLKRARTLLMDSSDTIESIARECGFSAPAFFRRVFRRTEGVSPSAFRQLYARVHINTM
jgi:AraC-like DNA-binding protein